MRRGGGGGGGVGMAAVLLLLVVAVTMSVPMTNGQVNPSGPVDPRETWAYKALKPSLAEQLREEREASSRPTLMDPLADVLLAGHAPDGDQYVKAIHERLKEQVERGSVHWLDTADRRQREEVANVVEYCTGLFASKGTDRDCVVQCHPPVDCGAQGARLCKDLYGKGNGDPFHLCVDSEEAFCRKHGAFHGEKYPAFVPRGETEAQRVQSVTEYCGNLFQMRGLRLPCLRTCTLFQMRHKRPDDYFFWKARQRRRFDATHATGAANPDPTDPPSIERAAWTDCEKRATNLCQFVEHDYWKECYERQKLRCTSKIGLWNDLVAH